MPIIERWANRKTLPVKNLAALFSLFLFSVAKAFSQQDSLPNAPLFLPLRIVRFDADVVSQSVQLRWAVSGSEEAKSFEIERADEGGAYKKVGSKLAGNRDGSTAYEFVDALPKKNTALAYRLKVIAKDGSPLYSGVQGIRIEDAALQYRLKQNPVHQQIELEVISAEAGSVLASIYTAYGQKVKSETTKFSAGTNRLSLSSQNLLPGLHRLVLESSGERKVISFVKE